LSEKASFPYLLLGYQNYCIFKHRAVARLVKNFAYETIYLSLLRRVLLMSKLTTTVPIKRPKSITVILTAEASERLTALAKKGKRSRQLEAMLRIHDSLKRVPEITGDYWEITTL
jgi:hypothetical protein